MNNEIVRSERLGDHYEIIDHPSGLRMLLAPMEGFRSAYALFGTAYGSIDTEIRYADGRVDPIPQGTAHYLEHKLFESEESSAFDRFAKTGASANAYTSFDRTAYLFSCSDHFAESIEILLDFVTHPYFTPETVEKERGIIGQEIRMYDDSPEWRVLFNMLTSMYVKNPVRNDIAGTVESIAEIDADLLYKCYGAFYDLSNMVLAVAGNFDRDAVLTAADKVLKAKEPVLIRHSTCAEPPEVLEPYTEQRLPVSVPQFTFGFKGLDRGERENLTGSVLDEIFAEAMAADYTRFYRELYDRELINSTFYSESFCGRDFCSTLYSGESKEPEKVADALRRRFGELRRDGIPEELFRNAQRSVYGHYLRSAERIEGIASELLNCHFAGHSPYVILDAAAEATMNSVCERVFSVYHEEHAVLSVIRPVAE